MKPYLDYKDIMKVTGLSKNNSYQIIKQLRKESEWEDTFEGRFISGIVIPSKIFVKYFPNSRKKVRELS